MTNQNNTTTTPATIDNPAARFSDFSPADWGAWAGCESENPQIAGGLDFDVILDGCQVGVSFYDVEDETTELFAHAFENEAVARAVAFELVRIADAPEDADKRRAGFVALLGESDGVLG